MRSIGFIDFYLSEWHANNYPAWLSEVNEKNGTDFAVKYAWAEQGVSPRDGVTSEEWCAKFGVELCETLEELCEKSDCLLILAPSDPEKHLQYAKTALTYGKPTYIDKTFAPTLAEAQEIFRIGEEHGTKLFSTSALRYAAELEKCGEPDSLLVTGGGSNLPEYFIHLGEMIVKKMGAIKSVKATRNGTQWVICAKTASGKDATMIYGSAMPYNVYMTKDGKESWKTVKSPFFDGLIADMISFFETGKTSFDTAQTLAVARLRDAVLAAVENPDTEIEI